MMRIGTTLVVLGAVSAVACSHDRETMTPASRTVGTTSQPSDSDERALSDAQIAGIMEAANTAEVQQGSIAQQNAQRQEVRDFATMMVKEHGKALEDGQRLSTKAGFGSASSDITSELRADNQGIISELNESDASDFDEEYIEHQIEVHQKVLKLLDDELIPNAVNPELRSSLLATRPVVAAHLERARSIKRMLE